jgi:hypothetical protein
MRGSTIAIAALFSPLAISSAGQAAKAPVAVSPGNDARLAQIADACPTFSWGATEGARRYQLVIYRLGGEGEEANPVLQESFPGSASSWTPSLDRCLQRGGHYAWSVRALRGRGASEWSIPNLFEVAEAPSRAELEDAVEVVRRYLAAQDGNVAGLQGSDPSGEILHQGPSRETPDQELAEGEQDVTQAAAEPTDPPAGRALVARADASTAATYAVYADNDSPDGIGVFGVHRASGGTGAGIHGLTDSVSGSAVGVLGEVSSTSPGGYSAAVRGINRGTGPTGIGGYFTQDGSGWGLYAQVSGSGRAVYGRATNATGTSHAGYFVNESSDGTGVYVKGLGQGRNEASLRVTNTRDPSGMATYMTNDSDFATGHFSNGGDGQVLYLTNGGTDGAGTDGGNFIEARNADESDLQFRVTTSGEVRSDVGFSSPGADFAELLRAVKGVEPGDVLAAGSSGLLVRSERPFQSNVLGVCSTAPAFLGGQPVDEVKEDHVPLALVGIVRVKVSAENGPILPGDMLVSSSTAGHAMNGGPDPPQGTVIGKALQTLSSERGWIRMLVLLQ